MDCIAIDRNCCIIFSSICNYFDIQQKSNPKRVVLFYFVPLRLRNTTVIGSIKADDIIKEAVDYESENYIGFPAST